MLRLLAEAQHQHDRLQYQIQELQQQHAALQAGAAALQKDRDHLQQQLRITEAELELLTGQCGSVTPGAPGNLGLLDVRPSSSPRALEVKGIDSVRQPKESHSSVFPACLTDADEIRQKAAEKQSIRAVASLKTALYDHSCALPGLCGSVGSAGTCSRILLCVWVLEYNGWLGTGLAHWTFGVS